ncbi:hypothetical protein EDB80DRAFT_416476 [Ilyonectria destructans]|nr:hypothetical protein EDB80DRAFT_416476 [Ilyonectria destructans]
MSPIVNLAQLAAWSKLLVTCHSLTPPPPGWRARVCPGRATLRCVCLYTPGPTVEGGNTVAFSPAGCQASGILNRIGPRQSNRCAETPTNGDSAASRLPRLHSPYVRSTTYVRQLWMPSLISLALAILALSLVSRRSIIVLFSPSGGHVRSPTTPEILNPGEAATLRRSEPPACQKKRHVPPAVPRTRLSLQSGIIWYSAPPSPRALPPRRFCAAGVRAR